MPASSLARGQTRALVLVLVGLAAVGLVPLWAPTRPLTRDVDCGQAIAVDGRLWCEESPPSDLGELCRRVGLWAPARPRTLHPGDAVDPIASCVWGQPPRRMRPEALEALALPVDVNTASPSELRSLPGVGPVTAGRIVDARPFGTIDELIRVKGIGPKRLARLRARARVRRAQR